MENSFETNLFNNLMDQWILPSVRERQERKELKEPLALRMAQIIFRTDSVKPEVRVNEQVKGYAVAELKEGLKSPIQAGDTINFDRLAGIKAFELASDDRNHGHATLIDLDDRWVIVFDFIYNKKLSQEHLSAAREFLFAAESSLAQDYLRPVIDNLHSACEFAVRAFLLGRPNKALVAAKSHDVPQRAINLERKRGNVDDESVNAFNKLQNLRPAARYLQSELSIERVQVEKLLQNVKGFIEKVHERSASQFFESTESR